MSVHELNERKAALQIIDVRSPGEWKKGHVPGAHHIFVPELRKRMNELDRKQANSGLLRQRLSREHCDKHFEAGWVSMNFGMFPAVGKRGKKRSCRSRGPTANERNNSATAAIIRRDDAGRYVGGFSRCSFSPDYRHSSSIPRGRRFRENIISLVITSRRFIRRNFSAIHRTAGSGRNRHGGPPGFCFRRHFLFFGRRAASGSPVITIVERTTKRSGLTRRHAPWASRAKATGASDRSR